jgi:hypothetical protein
MSGECKLAVKCGRGQTQCGSRPDHHDGPPPAPVHRGLLGRPRLIRGDLTLHPQPLIFRVLFRSAHVESLAPARIGIGVHDAPFNRRFLADHRDCAEGTERIRPLRGKFTVTLSEMNRPQTDSIRRRVP